MNSETVFLLCFSLLATSCLAAPVGSYWSLKSKDLTSKTVGRNTERITKNTVKNITKSYDEKSKTQEKSKEEVNVGKDQRSGDKKSTNRNSIFTDENINQTKELYFDKHMRHEEKQKLENETKRGNQKIELSEQQKLGNGTKGTNMEKKTNNEELKSKESTKNFKHPKDNEDEAKTVKINESQKPGDKDLSAGLKDHRNRKANLTSIDKQNNGLSKSKNKENVPKNKDTEGALEEKIKLQEGREQDSYNNSVDDKQIKEINNVLEKQNKSNQMAKEKGTDKNMIKNKGCLKTQQRTMLFNKAQEKEGKSDPKLGNGCLNEVKNNAKENENDTVHRHKEKNLKVSGEMLRDERKTNRNSSVQTNEIGNRNKTVGLASGEGNDGKNTTGVTTLKNTRNQGQANTMLGMPKLYGKDKENKNGKYEVYSNETPVSNTLTESSEKKNEGPYNSKEKETEVAKNKNDTKIRADKIGGNETKEQTGVKGSLGFKSQTEKNPKSSLGGAINKERVDVSRKNFKDKDSIRLKPQGSRTEMQILKFVEDKEKRLLV